MSSENSFYARYLGADAVPPAEQAQPRGAPSPPGEDRGHRNGDDAEPDVGLDTPTRPAEQQPGRQERPGGAAPAAPFDPPEDPDDDLTVVVPVLPPEVRPGTDRPAAGPPPPGSEPPDSGPPTGPQPTYELGYPATPRPQPGYRPPPQGGYPGGPAPGEYVSGRPAQPGGYPGGRGPSPQQPDAAAPPAPDYPGAPQQPQNYQRPPQGPGNYPGAPGGGARHASESVGPLRANIRAADLVKPYKEVPETGWRKAVYRSTRINFGLSPAERSWNDLRQRVGRNLRGTYLVGVVQEKGGVGKTSVTVGVGSALARYRDDKVVGIDANPASGNLAKRIDEPSQGTWRGLIVDQRLDSYSDFRHYLGKNSSGFEVLAGDRGDHVLTGNEVVELWRRLSRQYPVGLVDCGTQMRDDVMAAVLSMVDAVVVVSTTRLDGAEGAADTLNWLVEHGFPHLVRNAVVVISDVNKVSASGSVSKLHEQFDKAVRAVHFVPFDPHLSDATAVDFDRLKPETRRAFIETAASLVDGFAAAADKDPGALSNWRENR